MIRSNYSSKLSSELKRVAPKPIPVAVETLNIQIATGATLTDFAKAFVEEGYRKNPLLAERVALTEEELLEYIHYLISKRVEVVSSACKDWRKICRLSMPCFVELILTSIGKVQLRNQGIEIYPVVAEPSTMSYEAAMKVSAKVEAFEDCLAVVIGAMPGNMDGDESIMTMAVINGYVRSMSVVDDPVAEYITYFLQLTLEEQLFDNLYRMQYDDVKTIQAQIASLGRVLVN